jgi:competence protein ComEA
VSASLHALLAAGVLLADQPALAAKKALGPNERIDLNRAGTAELMRLPGVGEKRAAAIVATRSRQPFRKPEDVLAVKGIGPAWLARTRDHLVVAGATPSAPSPAAGAPAHAPARK